jgi:hypothetical protein
MYYKLKVISLQLITIIIYILINMFCHHIDLSHTNPKPQDTQLLIQTLVIII